MPYYMIHINLNKNQKEILVEALHQNTKCSLTITPKQIGDHFGDVILVTQKQYTQLSNGLVQNDPVTLKFSKANVNAMRSQIGSGILDSIGGFFNKAVTGVKNWWSGPKKPVNIEMKTINKADTLKNKANAFFDANRARNPIKVPVAPINEPPPIKNFMKTFKEPQAEFSPPPDFKPLQYIPASKPIKIPKPQQQLPYLSQPRQRNTRESSNLSNTLDSAFGQMMKFV